MTPGTVKTILGIAATVVTLGLGVVSGLVDISFKAATVAKAVSSDVVKADAGVSAATSDGGAGEVTVPNVPPAKTDKALLEILPSPREIVRFTPMGDLEVENGKRRLNQREASDLAVILLQWAHKPNTVQCAVSPPASTTPQKPEAKKAGK